MIFVDASAWVAIVSEEALGPRCMTSLLEDLDRDVITTSLALWECSMALSRKFFEQGRRVPIAKCNDLIQETLFEVGTGVVPITVTDWGLATTAAERYGRGSQSRAKLNLADCFHYAVASNHGAAILFTSPDEFHHTDLSSVLPKP